MVSPNLATVLTLIALILFKGALDVAGYSYVHETYIPYTFVLDLDLGKLVESYLLLVLLGLALPRDANRVSSVLVAVLVILSQIPVLSVFALANEARAWTYVTTFFWIATGLVLRFASLPLRLIGIRERRILLAGLAVLLAIAVSAVLFSILRKTGLVLSLDLSHVYATRQAYSEAVGRSGIYLINTAAFVLVPLLLGWAVVRRSFLIGVVAVLAQFLLFGTTGHKSYLFALLLSLALPWVAQKGRLVVFTLAVGSAASVAVSAIAFLVLADVWLSGLFVNRLFFLPATISFHYFDFFSSNPKLLLGQSILSGVFPMPYDTPVPQMLSGLFLHDDASSANTGMLGDAFANFGVPGVIVLLILFCATLLLIDRLARHKSERLCLAVLAMPVMFLLNGAFLTALLTGGLAVALLVTYLLPSEEANPYARVTGGQRLFHGTLVVSRSTDVASDPER